MDSKSFLKNKSILSCDNAAVKMTWVKIPTSFFFFSKVRETWFGLQSLLCYD